MPSFEEYILHESNRKISKRIIELKAGKNKKVKSK